MALDDDITLLASVPTLSLLEQDAQRLLAFAAQCLSVSAGDVLFRHGDAADGAYVVRSGRILMTIAANPPVQLIAGPGALIDEISMFIQTDRSGDAVAREECELIHVPRELMRRVLQEFPVSATQVRDQLAERLTELTGDMSRVGERMLRID